MSKSFSDDAIRPQEPVFPSAQDTLKSRLLVQELDSEALLTVIVRSGEVEFDLPEPINRALHQVLRIMATGRGVSLASVEQELSFQEAADLLQVPYSFLKKLVVDDAIAYQKDDANQRIRLEDLIAYKQRRDAARRDALTKLTQMSQEAGFYE